jgi:hypothetical protein
MGLLNSGQFAYGLFYHTSVLARTQACKKISAKADCDRAEQQAKQRRCCAPASGPIAVAVLFVIAIKGLHIVRVSREAFSEITEIFWHVLPPKIESRE